MPATEELKNELEKICTDLQAKIDRQNEQHAAAEKAHRAQMDALTGDARMAKNVLEKEIAELEAKRNDLAGTLNKALADVNAEKLRLAGEAEKLRVAQENLNKDHETIIAQIHDVRRRETDIITASNKIIEDRKALEKLVLAATEKMNDATREKAVVDSFRAEAARLLEDARKEKSEAEKASAGLMAEADEKVRQAEQTMKAADERYAHAETALNSANAIREEYTKKLEESQAWAMQNSAVASKLESWENALRWTESRLQEDKAKLALAEKEFAKKNKKENVDA